MGSISFPELNVPQYQAPDLLGQYAKVLAIKNAMQQQAFAQQMQPLQLQQQQLEVQSQQRAAQSQQALLRALTDDPHADPDTLAQSAMKYGAYPGDIMPTVNSLKDSAIKTQTLRGQGLDNAQKTTDAVGQQAQMLLATKDPQQRQQLYMSQTVPLMQQLGVPANMIPGAVPDDLWLQGKAAAAMRVDQQLDNARKQQEFEQVHGLIDPNRLQTMNGMLGNFAQVYGEPASKYQLQPGATWDDYSRTDKLMEHTEKAAANQAQLATSNAIRNQTYTLAAQGQNEQDYNRNLAELNNTFKPVTDMLPRLSRLQATLAQNSPQADALVAPELLTIMAGGPGSGLRMNEAEITRIIGGRSKWQDLQAAAQKWSLDPTKASSITPEQRTQIHSLVNAVAEKAQQQLNAYALARQQLLGTNDPNLRRQIITNATLQSMKINTAGAGAPAAGYTRIQASDGSLHDIPTGNLPAARKIDPNLQVMQ